jgi:hypothetical protein
MAEVSKRLFDAMSKVKQRATPNEYQAVVAEVARHCYGHDLLDHRIGNFNLQVEAGQLIIRETL